jgi:phosphoribosylaminoimidazolecarboxamide formyltransferase/IMP cyclohydrolase
MAEIFFEVVIAPAYSEGALQAFAKKKSLRLLEVPLPTASHHDRTVRTIDGGLLVQDADQLDDDPSAWTCVTKRTPTDQEMRDLTLAWEVARHVKSNAIVFVHDEAIVGVGSGQPNRLESVRIAATKAGDKAHGAVLASDAFFPFADGLLAGVTAGVTAVIQPGGSVRDDEVISAADEAGLAMIFTGVRHFLH